MPSHVKLFNTFHYQYEIRNAHLISGIEYCYTGHLWASGRSISTKYHKPDVTPHGRKNVSIPCPEKANQTWITLFHTAI